MGEENCALLDKCLVVKETKKNKRLTRLVNCNNCDKAFHVYCCGWKELSENEVTEIESTFVCNKCSGFISAVADKIYEKINYELNAMREEITQLRLSNVELKATVEKYKCKLPNTTHTVVANSGHDDTSNCVIIDKHTADNGDRNSNDNKSDEIVITSDPDVDSDYMPVNKNTKHNNKSLSTSDNTLTYYLCSVENILTVDDVRIILMDANISLAGIKILEAKGNFKNKKFLVISSDESVKIFNFKLCFNDSKLNGTWFLRLTPPKLKSHPMKNNYNEKKHINFTSVSKQDTYVNTRSKMPQNSQLHYMPQNSQMHYKKQNSQSTVKYHNFNQNRAPPINNAYQNQQLQNSTQTNLHRNIPDYANCFKNTNNGTLNKNNVVSFLENLLHVAKKT